MGNDVANFLENAFLKLWRTSSYLRQNGETEQKHVHEANGVSYR